MYISVESDFLLLLLPNCIGAFQEFIIANLNDSYQLLFTQVLYLSFNGSIWYIVYFPNNSSNSQFLHYNIVIIEFASMVFP